MTDPSYVDDDDGWMDPNLTEPKLQDDLNHRLSLNRRVRQRPRAAYGFKSAPNQQQQQQQAEMTQIRYFKYVPYNGMSEPEKRRYLSLGPARLTSSRTAPPQPAAQTATESTAAASFWPSASRTKSLKVYDYHLAELSMTYRSQPSLLNCPRRQISTPTMSPRHQSQYQHQATFSTPRRPLFFQLHSSRGVPASAPSATQQELQVSHRHTADLAEKTTQVSRGGTPFIDSALSDYPTEPRDVVSKSDSNRLLNVVSVDECHVRHRRRRRRLRRVHPSQDSSAAEVDGVDAWEDDEAAEEAYEEGEFDEEEEEEEVGGWRDSEAAADAVEAAGREAEVRETVPEVTDAQDFRQEVVSQQLEQQESAGTSTTPVVAAVEPAAAPSVITTRPTTERSGAGGRKKRRTEKEMRKIAATKFLRRNEILREKMAIYLDWKLNQERMGLIELRLGDPAARFERFTVDLVQHEAMVASQYRDGDNGAGGGVGDGAEVSNDDARGTGQESPQLDLQGDPVNLGSSKQTASATGGPTQQRQELSLTEMYEALSA